MGGSGVGHRIAHCLVCEVRRPKVCWLKIGVWAGCVGVCVCVSLVRRYFTQPVVSPKGVIQTATRNFRLIRTFTKFYFYPLTVKDWNYLPPPLAWLGLTMLTQISDSTRPQPYLTGGNWQKWKRVFLTYPCHEIDRDEAVGLKSCKNTWKITIFVKMWNLGQYRENLIFCQ